MKVKILILIIILFPTIIFSQNNKKIGLVLSGGAAKGFAHIGVLKVLEREGIVPDYITGTSMGAIIGSLYAIGYSATEIEKIILSQDWNGTFNDKLTRDQLNILDKRNKDQYFFTLPINEYKLNLPQGLIRGQKIYNMLVKYTAHVHHIDNFNEFAIPFKCIGTDISTGESITMDHGYLPEILRASMAMPTIFTPVKYEGRMLVDGGLVNNFPVSEAIEMGAEIIIGSDVQDPLLDNEKLNSISNILYQSIKFLRLPKYHESIKKCDILINTKLNEYGAQEFTKAKTFIEIGENSAELMIEEIRKLKEISISKVCPVRLEFPDKIKITDIEFEGLDNLSYHYVQSMIGLNINQYYSINEITNAANKAYASGFFELVYYKLMKNKNGFKLHIYALEKNYDELKVGIHYNSDFNAAIMFQLNFDNIFYQGTNLSLDFALGENPRAILDYSWFTSWKSRYFFRNELNNFDLFTYSGDQETSSFALTTFMSEVGVERQISKNLAFGGGAMFEFASLGEIVDPLKLQDYDNTFFVLRTFLNMDTFDRIYFPKSGVMWNIEFRKVWDLSSTDIEDKDKPYSKFNAEMLYGRYSQAIKYNDKLTFIPSFYGGVTFGRQQIPLTYRFYLGGLSTIYIKGIFPFVGMEFMQKTGDKLWIARLDAQYEILKNTYLTMKTNFGETFLDIDDLYDQYGLNWGIGLSIGYASIVGPVEFNYMWSTEVKSPVTYFRIGVGM